MLRPYPDKQRGLEKFRRYTQSWMRPASEEDGGTFRVWEGDAGPPTHSIPPHLVAKAAASIHQDAFERVHERLLHAYFAESRDVTDPATLREIWEDAELDPAEFERAHDPALLKEVAQQHSAAIEAGVTGVPAVQLAGQDVVITGAHPRELYRRWARRALEDAAQAERS